MGWPAKSAGAERGAADTPGAAVSKTKRRLFRAETPSFCAPAPPRRRARPAPRKSIRQPLILEQTPFGLCPPGQGLLFMPCAAPARGVGASSRQNSAPRRAAFRPGPPHGAQKFAGPTGHRPRSSAPSAPPPYGVQKFPCFFAKMGVFPGVAARTPYLPRPRIRPGRAARGHNPPSRCGARRHTARPPARPQRQPIEENFKMKASENNSTRIAPAARAGAAPPRPGEPGGRFPANSRGQPGRLGQTPARQPGLPGHTPCRGGNAAAPGQAPARQKRQEVR